MTTPTVLYDACVLYPFELRDAFVRLARTGLYRAKWTERIHDEWMRALLEAHPEYRDSLVRCRAAMNRAVPDCLVEQYEVLIPALRLPDENDRHVLAAAIHCRADAIITFNLKHFPRKVLSRHGIVATHPDEFIDNLIDLDPEAVRTAFRDQRAAYRNPPLTAEQLLDCLAGQGLRTSTATLRRWAADL
jgi:hypothetical protein